MSDTDDMATYRLKAVWLWLALSCAWTVVMAALLARQWLRSLDRPWFLLLLLVALGIGGWWIRYCLRQRRVVRLVGDPPALELHGITRPTDTIPLDGVAGVEILEKTLTGRAPSVVGSRSLRVAVRRVEMAIVWDDGRRVEIRSMLPTRGSLREFARQVSVATTGGEPTVRTVTEPRLQFLPDSDRRLVLNPDAGQSGPGAMAGLVALAVAGVMLTVVAPIIVTASPTYDSRIVPADELLAAYDEWHATLGPAPAPAAVEVTLTEQRCRRDEEWLWGESGGVARLVGLATLEPPRAELTAVRRRLDRVAVAAYEGRWTFGSTGDRDDGTYLHVPAGVYRIDLDGDEGELMLDFETPCLRGDDRARVAGDTEAFGEQLLAWLAGAGPATEDADGDT